MVEVAGRKPLKGNYVENADYPGVFSHEDGSNFVKVFNDLRNSQCLLEFKSRSKLEAFAYARFFEALRREGFYPPSSGFFVSHDSGGRPSVVAVMPRLKPCEEHCDEIAQLQRVPFRVLGFDFNRRNLNDPLHEFNYGRDSHKVYSFDLHVFKSDCFRKRVLAWHRGLPEQRF